jgi:6-pyruvoyltetrahydropterin/6-carboxytetrahydropterin synthase
MTPEEKATWLMTRGANYARVRGEVDPAIGWLIDFAGLKRGVDPLVARLDHHVLNEVDGLANLTSKMLAVWLWDRLAPNVPLLCRVTVETCSSRCHYFGPEPSSS